MNDTLKDYRTGCLLLAALAMLYSSHAPAWEFSLQRSSVAGRWSVYHCIPTPERGNDVSEKT